ncbi:MAG: ABC transporter permease, partial [Clostridia bacterium]|nr:ABC transporter permease [Clostridia bacterium]
MKRKLLAAPYLVWMAVFVVVPLLMVAYFAFTDGEGHFTLDYVAGVAQYSNIFVRSIWLAAIATVICLVLAYPLAYILARMDWKVQSTMLMIVILPMWMNFLLRTYAWMTLLGNEGIINTVLGFFHLGPFKLLNTRGAVVLGMVYDYLPFMILPLYSVMVKIDKSVIEAANDLGCNSLKTLF